MPKIKTHKASAKRMKLRKSGSLKRRNAYATHLLGGRSSKRKRGARRNTLVSSADMDKARLALGLK